MVNAFEKATGQKVPYELSDRRPGDVASAYASTDLAEKELGWKSRLGIEDFKLFESLLDPFSLVSCGHVDSIVLDCKAISV